MLAILSSRLPMLTKARRLSVSAPVQRVRLHASISVHEPYHCCRCTSKGGVGTYGSEGSAYRLRLGVTENWRSRWYADKTTPRISATTLQSVHILRSALRKQPLLVLTSSALAIRSRLLFSQPSRYCHWQEGQRLMAFVRTLSACC